jgi:hypothetical protein
MRINIYEDELTPHAELVSATTEDGDFVGVRMWLKSPDSLVDIKRESAVTIWADSTKRLKKLFVAALEAATGEVK